MEVGNELNTIIASAVSILTGAGAAVFYARRKLSRDNVEIAKDRAEENVIKHLEEQRDFALAEKEKILIRFDKVDSEKTEMLGKVYKLTSEVENLSGQIKILKEFVDRLGKTLDETRELLDRCNKEGERIRDQLALQTRENEKLIEKLRSLGVN